MAMEEYIPQTLKKTTIDRDVYSMALDRVRHCFRLADHVNVSFSGGKDSSVILNLAYQVAKETNRLPLDVVFWDEEAVPLQTEEYVERVRQLPGINMRWLCVPIKHVNACSPKSPYWHPWHPEQQDLWVRPIPNNPNVETDLPGFKFGMTIPDAAHLLGKPGKTTVNLLGIRADESLRRLMACCRKETDNYITEIWNRGYVVKAAYPIYDWFTEDVWLAPKLYGWDYNAAYDLMEAGGMMRRDQRVAPPFGEQPLCNLWMYSVLFPEVWGRMSKRVPGAATAARYSRSVLYSFKDMEKPPDVTWKEMVTLYLYRWPPEFRVQIAERIENDIKQHFMISGGEGIEEEKRHPITGVSWRYFAAIACRGDLKSRKRAQRAATDVYNAHAKSKEGGWFDDVFRSK